MSDVLQDTTLVMATLAMGLMAGVFSLYAHTIMPGLGRTDDRTFVTAFQSIDEAIVNPWFLPVYLGALVLTGLAAGLRVGDDGGPTLSWIVAAFVLYLATVLITLTINVPLNDAIKAAGHTDQIGDLAAVRKRFDEARWRRWNVVRAVATMAAFVSLALAISLVSRR
jgi:uncharacterized membrane protein